MGPSLGQGEPKNNNNIIFSSDLQNWNLTLRFRVISKKPLFIFGGKDPPFYRGYSQHHRLNSLNKTQNIYAITVKFPLSNVSQMKQFRVRPKC